MNAIHYPVEFDHESLWKVTPSFFYKTHIGGQGASSLIVLKEFALYIMFVVAHLTLRIDLN